MPATDLFASYAVGLDAPYTKAVAVTPNDSTELANVTRAIYIGGAGNVNCQFADDSSTVTLTGLLVGVVYRHRLRLIRSTSTTATNIVALY